MWVNYARNEQTVTPTTNTHYISTYMIVGLTWAVLLVWSSYWLGSRSSPLPPHAEGPEQDEARHQPGPFSAGPLGFPNKNMFSKFTL